MFFSQPPASLKAEMNKGGGWGGREEKRRKEVGGPEPARTCLGGREGHTRQVPAGLGGGRPLVWEDVHPCPFGGVLNPGCNSETIDLS